MAEVLDNFLESNDWTEVEKGDRANSESEMLGIDCLGTCLGLAAYDPDTGEGYLLHAGTLENKDLETQVDSFMDEVEGLEGPYEVLAGGTISAEYNPLSNGDFAQEARQLTEDLLEKRGIEYEAAWNDAPVFNRMFVSPEYGILYDAVE